MILWEAIFGESLPVMALLAERLPVILIPEELLISAVRNDVVDDCRLDVSSGLGTFGTQRMCLKEPLAFSLPGLPVSPDVCRPHLFRVLWSVYLTVLSTGRDKGRAAGMAAGMVRSSGHMRLRMVFYTISIPYSTRWILYDFGQL